MHSACSVDLLMGGLSSMSQAGETSGQFMETTRLHSEVTLVCYVVQWIAGSALQDTPDTLVTLSVPYKLLLVELLLHKLQLMAQYPRGEPFSIQQEIQRDASHTNVNYSNG